MNTYTQTFHIMDRDQLTQFDLLSLEKQAQIESSNELDVLNEQFKRMAYQVVPVGQSDWLITFMHDFNECFDTWREEYPISIQFARLLQMAFMNNCRILIEA